VPTFGTLHLAEVTCKDFRKALQDGGRSGKTAQNILGVPHKAMADAVEEGILASNPVPQLQRKSARRVSLSNSDPLTIAEVRLFLARVPNWYRHLYDIWFRVGWRPSEILAVRFGWIAFLRRTINLRRARIARWGSVEAPPKPGEREVDRKYDPAICSALERLRRRSLPNWEARLRFHW
jgi:integrase